MKDTLSLKGLCILGKRRTTTTDGLLRHGVVIIEGLGVSLLGGLSNGFKFV
jgi:hypothetical protein